MDSDNVKKVFCDGDFVERGKQFFENAIKDAEDYFCLIVCHNTLESNNIKSTYKITAYGMPEGLAKLYGVTCMNAIHDLEDNLNEAVKNKAVGHA